MTDLLGTPSANATTGAARRALGLPKMMRQALKVVWAAAPRVFGATVGLQIIGAIALVVQLLAGKALLTKVLDNGGVHEVQQLIPLASVLVGAFAIAAIVTATTAGLQHLLSELVTRYAMQRVLTAATTVDLIQFESVELHDKLQRALVNAGSRPLQMSTGLVNVLSAIAGSLGVGTALLFISPELLAIAVIGAIPVWLFGMNSSRSLYQFAVRQTELDRQRLYVQLLLSSRDWAKEVRAYRLGPIMLDRWEAMYRARLADLTSVLRGRVRRGIAGVVLASLVLGAALATLLWLVVDGRVPIASAAAAAGALLVLSRQLQSLANGSANLYESALFMQDFSVFVAVEEMPEQDPPGAHAAIPSREVFRELVVENLSFTYPSSTRQVLDDISLRIGAGEVIALVGENGSGKSTLAKLIAGLYSAAEGTIRWNNHDYHDSDLDDIRTNMAVLFQDFIKFQLTVSENISLGRPSELASPERVDAAAVQAGATELINHLPNGVQTQLGPQFVGGTELSGGQWQRIALARAAYRDAAVVILDEPTAALDPLAEAALFDSTSTVFNDKAVILISHRFGSVRKANRIYVLSHGRIIEQGTHQDLLRHDGHYAQMYEAQRVSLIGPDQSGSSDADSSISSTLTDPATATDSLTLTGSATAIDSTVVLAPVSDADFGSDEKFGPDQ